MPTPNERKRILGENLENLETKNQLIEQNINFISKPPAPLTYQIKIEHHLDCPLGANGLDAYWQARIALSSTPPEAQATMEDRIALCMAQWELEQKQTCKCGATAAQIAQIKSR